MATAFNGLDISFVVGMVVAGSLYLIVTRSLDVAAAAHDAGRSFDCFAPDGAIVSYSEGDTSTTDAYRARWGQWEADGFAVEGCDSLDAQVQILGPEAAVWTPRVRVRLAGAGDENRQRETIVFVRSNGRWLAIHEQPSFNPVQR